MAELVSKRYAKALFDIAAEKNEIDAYNEYALGLLEIFENDKSFLQIINHPSVTGEQKTELVGSTLRGKVPDDFIALFELVFRKNRETELREMFESFVGLVMEHKKIVTARVFSAAALSKEQTARIKSELAKKLNKTVEIVAETDPSLIAGLKILVDGHIIDGSVKSRMNELKKQLLSTPTA